MAAGKINDPKSINLINEKLSATKKGVTTLRAARPYARPDFSSFELQMNGQSLTGNQREAFFRRLEELATAKVHIIYRGDKKDRLLSKFNLHQHAFPTVFNDYLFLIGDKGRHFWKDALKKKRPSLLTFGLEDTSKEFLELIFEMLRSILTKKNYTASLQSRLKKFATENPAFFKFFKNKKNKIEFVDKILNASSTDRLKARDYYLTLLHQFGKNNFYPVSFLLSATRRFSVAKNFIRWEQIADNGIILFGWVPINEGYLLYTKFNFFSRRIVQVIGLPVMTSIFYKEQYEITLKGGLLPHYIMGYFYRINGIEYFEVNPAVFNINDKDWPLQGLSINQSGFEKQTRDTQLKKVFFVSPLGDFSEFLK